MIGNILLISMINFFCLFPKYNVDITSVKFTDISLAKSDIKVDVAVSYRWIFPLKISDIKYRLLFNDVVVAEGKYPGDIKLGKKADTLLSFPITISHQNLPLPLIKALLTGKFNYEVDMNLKFNMWIFRKKHKKIFKGEKNL